MRIFRLPAHLNAFRVNVLNISSRFRIPPFSIPVRPRCAVPPCYPLPVSPCLDSSRSPSRFIPLVWRIALVSLGSPFLSPSHLFPSALPPPSSRRHPRPAHRVVRSRNGAEQVVAIRCVCYYLVDIRSVSSAYQARPVHRVAVRGDRRGGRALPMPSARLCDFRAAVAICIYSFRKSPNI